MLGQISRPVQTKLGYGYNNSTWRERSASTTNNFLGNQTVPRNLCSPTGSFSGRRFAIRRSGTGTKKKMDLTKVFGTRDQWDDHRCRQIIWSVFKEGITYCGGRMTPDDFSAKLKFPFLHDDTCIGSW